MIQLTNQPQELANLNFFRTFARHFPKKEGERWTNSGRDRLYRVVLKIIALGSFGGLAAVKK